MAMKSQHWIHKTNMMDFTYKQFRVNISFPLYRVFWEGEIRLLSIILIRDTFLVRIDTFDIRNHPFYFLPLIVTGVVGSNVLHGRVENKRLNATQNKNIPNNLITSSKNILYHENFSYLHIYRVTKQTANFLGRHCIAYTITKMTNKHYFFQ